jgi:hypothetical protein
MRDVCGILNIPPPSPTELLVGCAVGGKQMGGPLAARRAPDYCPGTGDISPFRWNPPWPSH